jgi:hypothetical protein
MRPPHLPILFLLLATGACAANLGDEEVDESDDGRADQVDGACPLVGAYGHVSVGTPDQPAVLLDAGRESVEACVDVNESDERIDLLCWTFTPSFAPMNTSDEECSKNNRCDLRTDPNFFSGLTIGLVSDYVCGSGGEAFYLPTAGVVQFQENGLFSGADSIVGAVEGALELRELVDVAPHPRAEFGECEASFESLSIYARFYTGNGDFSSRQSPVVCQDE